MSIIKRLIEEIYANVTIDGAKTTETIDVAEGSSIAFVTTASSSSSPTGTSIQLQGSLDGTNFFAIGSAVDVTTDASYTVSATGLAYRYYRLSYAWSSGSYVATTSVLVKGESV